MTKIAISRMIPSPFVESWNAWALPWKLVTMVAGSTLRAASSTRATASPSATPGITLKDSVTDGNWPVWLTDSGPTPVDTVVTLDSGSNPVGGRGRPSPGATT